MAETISMLKKLHKVLTMAVERENLLSLKREFSSFHRHLSNKNGWLSFKWFSIQNNWNSRSICDTDPLGWILFHCLDKLCCSLWDGMSDFTNIGCQIHLQICPERSANQHNDFDGTSKFLSARGIPERFYILPKLLLLPLF